LQVIALPAFMPGSRVQLDLQQNVYK
jgi:hypothetical protein